LVWAGALALIFAPLQRWMEARVKRPGLAATFSLIIIGLLVVVPATWFAQKLAEQAITVPQNIQKQLAGGKWHMRGGEHPQLAHYLALIEQQVSSRENAAAIMNWVKTSVSRLAKESAMAAVQVCLTLYFLFYFLRDRVRVLKAIRSLLPLSESDARSARSRGCLAG
jgi:predicted PurR-regulated permease PerM